MCLIVLFSVFNSAVLKPDFHLIFSQIERGSQILSFWSNDILLSFELLFQNFQLLWSENGSCPFSLAIAVCIIDCKEKKYIKGQISMKEGMHT